MTGPSLPDEAGKDLAFGSPQAFADWVRPHWKTMYALAARLAGPGVADDVVQDALVDAWRHRATFDLKRGTPRTWLLTIVANRARRSKYQREQSELTDLPVDSSAATVSEALDIAHAISRLPRRQRLAVALHYYAGLTVSETAEVMRCSSGTVKATLSAARKHLLDDLGSGYR